MAKITTKLASGAVKTVQTLTGVETTIANDAVWRVLRTPNSVAIYAEWEVDSDPENIVFADPVLNAGNTIFGASTPAAVTDALLGSNLNLSGAAGSAGPTSINTADIATGVDASANVLDIKNSLQALVAKADDQQVTLLQDSTGAYFYARINTTTGAISNLSLTGAAYTPVLPVQAPDPDKDLVVVETKYDVISSGTGYNSNDQLTRIYSKLGANAPTFVWLNDTQLTVLSSVPVPSDIRALENFQEDLLESIASTSATIDANGANTIETYYTAISSSPEWTRGDDILVRSYRGTNQFYFNISTGQFLGQIPTIGNGADMILSSTYWTQQVINSLNSTNLKTAPKGITPSGNPTSSSVSGDIQALDVKLAGQATSFGSTDVATLRVVASNDSPEVQTFGDANDVSVPASNTANATVKGLLRRLLNLTAANTPSAIAKNAGAITADTTRIVTASDDPQFTQIGLAADISVPATATSPSTVKGLLRFISNAVTTQIARNIGAADANTIRVVAASNSPEILALGDVTDVAIPANASATGSVKGLLRLFINTIGVFSKTAGPIDGNTVRTVAASNSPEVLSLGDATDVTVPANSTSVASVKGLLRLLIDRVNANASGTISKNAGTTDANTTRIVAATDDPILLSVGNNADTTLASGLTSIATQKALLRGIWGSAGLTTDTAATNSTAGWSVISLLKGLYNNSTIAKNAGAIDNNTTRIVTSSDDPQFVQIGTATDVSVPGSTAAAATVKGLLRFIANRVNYTTNNGNSDATTLRVNAADNSPDVLAVGPVAEVTAATTPTGAGSLKAVLRGIYQTTGTGSDATATTTVGTFSQIALLKLLIDSTGQAASSAATNSTGTWSINALLKGLFENTKFSKAAGATDGTTIRVTTTSDDPLITQVGLAADVSVPATSAATATLKGLLRLLINNLGVISKTSGNIDANTTRVVTAFDDPQFAQIGIATDVTTPASITATATVKGLLRLLGLYIRPNTTRAGNFNQVDNSYAIGTFRQIAVTNNTAAVIYLQFHNKATPLVTGDIPAFAQSYRIGANTTFLAGPDFFGTAGTNMINAPGSANTRVALSSTFATYTAAPTAGGVSISVEVNNN